MLDLLCEDYFENKIKSKTWGQVVVGNEGLALLYHCPRGRIAVCLCREVCS